MAIIVPTGTLTWGVGPVWTLTEKGDDEIMKKMKNKARGNQWSLHFLVAAGAVMENNVDEKHDNLGIKSPKPIGIITYEDVIDTILQKTSLDEKDLYERNTLSTPTKTRKAVPIDIKALLNSHASSGCKPPQTSVVSKSSSEPVKNTLRRRKVTDEKTVCAIDSSRNVAKIRPSAPGAMDGAYEYTGETWSDDLNIRKTRGKSRESSYTANSQGGFHADGSSHSIDNGNMLAPNDVAELIAAASLGHPKCSSGSRTMRSLPPRRRDSRLVSDELKQKLRHVSAAPKLPTVRRVTHFSRGAGTSLGNESVTDLTIPEQLTAGEQDEHGRISHRNASGFDISESVEEYFDGSANDHVPEKSGDTKSLQSDEGEENREDDLTLLYDAFPVSFPRPSPEISQPHGLVAIAENAEKKYDGFPMELLDDKNQENRTPKYVSATMPRTIGTEELEIFECMGKKSPRGREVSFHDDRALLPSQRKFIEQNEGSVSNTRRTSIWF